ncbi:MAG: hypothetical protein GY754_05265 [bacterium]|nr:hypothetical protein [bacterium]
MRQRLYYIPLIFILLWTTHIGADEEFSRYRDSRHNFSILIPRIWTKAKVDLKYKQILVLSRRDRSEIKITATKPDPKEKEKWKNWKKWYTKGIGRRLSEIIETKAITINKNITGKLLIFEYVSRGRRVLQKILLARFNETLLVIECSSPIKSFYKHDETFNIVMGSLMIGTDDSVIIKKTIEEEEEQPDDMSPE